MVEETTLLQLFVGAYSRRHQMIVQYNQLSLHSIRVYLLEPLAFQYSFDQRVRAACVSTQVRSSSKLYSRKRFEYLLYSCSWADYCPEGH